MAFDYKKEYKALYQPPREPQFVTVPAMTFAAVRGQGDPNDPTGEYKAAIELLYGLLYTIKMSKKSSHRVDGYFDFVVPPLEGLWEQTGTGKESFHWISMLRLPEFVTREEFDWAVREATAKKKKDFSKVEFFTYDEGLCVQCMHLGSYDDEPETLARMNAFAAEQGYAVDFSETRFHHELYLSDPNRTGKAEDHPATPAQIKLVIQPQAAIIEERKKSLSGGGKRGMDMKLPEKKQRWVYHAEALPQTAGEGVTRRVLAYTDGLMCVENTFEKGAVGALHHHPHTQITYVVSGAFDFTVDGVTHTVRAGDTILKEDGVEHGCVCTEAGILLDIFTPMREDFVYSSLRF